MGTDAQSRTKGNPYLQTLLVSGVVAVVAGLALMFSNEPGLGELLDGAQVVGAALFSVGLTGIFGWLVAGAIVWSPGPLPSSEPPRRNDAPSGSTFQADWYDDPDGSGNQRWYNGKEWTDSTRVRPS